MFLKATVLRSFAFLPLPPKGGEGQNGKALLENVPCFVSSFPKVPNSTSWAQNSIMFCSKLDWKRETWCRCCVCLPAFLVSTVASRRYGRMNASLRMSKSLRLSEHARIKSVNRHVSLEVEYKVI